MAKNRFKKLQTRTRKVANALIRNGAPETLRQGCPDTVIRAGYVMFNKTPSDKPGSYPRQMAQLSAIQKWIRQKTGSTPEAKTAFLRSPEWRRVRYKALKMSKGRCECCGRSAKDGAVLNVDHIMPRKTHPQLALKLSNLQVLCGACNHGKGNTDTTDWREPSLRVLMGEAVNIE